MMTASHLEQRQRLLALSPLSPEDSEQLLRDVTHTPRSFGVREALLQPAEAVLAGHSAFESFRAHFPKTGPFSFLELGDAILIWATAARMLGADGPLEEAIAELFWAGREHLASLSLFQPLLMASERNFVRFVELGGTWRALMASFGQVEAKHVDGRIQLSFSNDHTYSARYYIPGFYKAWMQVLKAQGTVRFQGVDGTRFQLEIHLI